MEENNQNEQPERKQRQLRKRNKLPSSSQTLSTYMITKLWDTTFKRSVLSQEEIEWRIYNDLPLDDVIDNKSDRKKPK